jgi:hypothetical protein
MKTTLLICAVVLSFFVCCKQADANSYSNMEQVDYDAVAIDTTAAAMDAVSDKDEKVMSISLPSKPKPMESKIIKSGTLRYQSDDLDKTYAQIQAAVKKI